MNEKENYATRNAARQNQGKKCCARCGKEGPLRTVRVRRTERMEGAASYGTVTLHYCEECITKNRQTDKNASLPSSKQLKNLLKNAKKGLL